MATGLRIDSSLVRVSDGLAFTRHDFLDASPSVTTFNRVAFLSGGAMNADQILLSNIDVTLDAIEDPGESLGARLFGIDFNRHDAPSAPSQGLCRVLGGSGTQAANPASITKSIGSRTVTVSQPGATALEFRGANGDGSRAIPGGDISRPFMVADFIGTRTGRLDLAFSGLPAGDYVCRSYHLDPFTGSALGLGAWQTPLAYLEAESLDFGNVHRFHFRLTAPEPAASFQLLVEPAP